MQKATSDRLRPQFRLLEILKLERRDVALLFLLMSGVGLISLVIPLAVQSLVNTVTMGGLIKPLLIISIMLFVFLFMAGLFYVLELFIVELIQRRIFVRTAVEVAHKTQSTLFEISREQNLQELMNRFFEVTAVQKASATLLTVGVATMLQGLVGSVVLIFYSAYFTIIVALILLVLVMIVFVIGRKAEVTAIEESHAKFDVAAWLETIARNLNTFKFSAGVDLAIYRTEQLAEIYLKKRSLHFRCLLKQYFGGVLIYAFGGTAMLAVGGALVINGQINLGQFVAAELIIFAVLASFLRFIGQLEYYYDLLAGLDKLGYLQDLPQEEIPENPIDITRPLSLRAVDLGYDFLQHTGHQSGINFQLEAGKSLGVLGSPGSGKSSMAALLTGLKKPDKGRVEYNGVDVGQFSPNQLRKHIGSIGRLEMLEGSIVDNVLIGRRDIPLSKVTALLHQLGLMDLINSLPEGLDTQLAVTGAPLSSTQANLLMLARAVVGQPALLIIDSMFDLLDDDTLARVLPLVLSNQGSSVIILTRKHQIAQQCDQTLSLEVGYHG
jgi:putative ABC transport system ATP-binding protein